MFASVLTAALAGLDAFPVEVEVDISAGSPAWKTVGLAEGAVREAQERVKSAIRKSGYEFPLSKVTVNLTSADVRKEGPAFDLPIALGILAAHGALKGNRLRDHLVLGELAPDGRVKCVKGALPIALLARARGLKGIVLPRENSLEASIVGDGVAVFGVETLGQAIEFVEGLRALEPVRADAAELFNAARHYEVDLSEVKGQQQAKRALEVAAAGSHNVLMVGPRGSGKTMLAKRLPTILPAMTLDEAIEVTKVHSVAGLLDGRALIGRRPFRAPHHTISDTALIGGGALPQPGEVSLAHHGVLFLDDLPEFRRNVLEVLRQPLEDDRVTISRVAGTLTFPADFMLVGAMNGCPCGFYGDQERECTCTPLMVQRYRSRISGPLLDRIDIHIEVPRAAERDLANIAPRDTSAAIRKRVIRAREIQLERFRYRSFSCNARMEPRDLRPFCEVDSAGERLLELAINRLRLSAYAYTRILKVARTIADLDESGRVETQHISEAVQYRSLDRQPLRVVTGAKLTQGLE